VHQQSLRAKHDPTSHHLLFMGLKRLCGVNHFGFSSRKRRWLLKSIIPKLSQCSFRSKLVIKGLGVWNYFVYYAVGLSPIFISSSINLLSLLNHSHSPTLLIQLTFSTHQNHVVPIRPCSCHCRNRKRCYTKCIQTCIDR
jgi:hypothetical protein